LSTSDLRAARCTRAFTLIELLVALFITAIVFAIGYGTINQALRNGDYIKDRQERLTAVQTAMRVMVQDFAQLTPRPVRDLLGTTSLACLVANPPTDASLSTGPTTLASSMGVGVSSNSSSSSSSSSSSDSSSASTSSSGSSTTLGGAGLGASLSSSTSSGSAPIDLVAFTRTGWANPAGIQRPALERVSYRLEKGVLKRMHWPVLDATEASVPIGRDLLSHVKSVRFRYLTDARQWITQWPPIGNTSLRMRPFAIEVTLELEDWGRIVRVIEVPA
jgi:prepilin-type N-terminal cleavage/methylation domain-containing protein